MDELWVRYLYGSQSPAELKRLVRQLRWFRFCRAYGGHANDGDHLLLALSTPSAEDAHEVCDALGIGLRPLISQPVPEPGRKYTAREWSAMSSQIRHMPDWREPGHVVIAGARVFVWVDDARTTLSVSDTANIWAATQESVDRAIAIEDHLSTRADLLSRLIDPPQDNRNCLSPQTHPELFE